MQPRLAVLIDAENVPSKYWSQISQRVETLGAMNCCRVFGDFSEGRLIKWLALARDEGLQPVLQFSGKNACDIAMTIAAMDILNGGKTEAICLVSSDKDFAPLVQRLRASGLKVYGFGEAKASPALQKAFTAFHVLANIKPKPGIVLAPARRVA